MLIIILCIVCFLAACIILLLAYLRITAYTHHKETQAKMKELGAILSLNPNITSEQLGHIETIKKIL